MPSNEVRRLRGHLLQVQAKYDGGGMPIAIYNVCKGLEREIAWAEQAEAARREPPPVALAC